MTDRTDLDAIVDGCDRCCVCDTPILPGQRRGGTPQQRLGSGMLRSSSVPVHDIERDCIDGLLRRVAGVPAWHGAEDRIYARRSLLNDYDIVTGTFDRGTR